jgi:ethanolamine utilization protein EutN
MKLGRVVGSVVASRKSPRLEGFKLLMVRGMKPDGTLEKDYLVAVDAVGAGSGEVVLTVTGSSAREDDRTKKAATDTTIVSIVDRIEMIRG